ncbi:MAG: hypothetical protein AB7H70_02205 [Rhodospirillaceae bacterium]
MKPMMIAGILLIVGGIAALVFGGITYTKHETVLDVGPIELEAKNKESIPIPEIAAILAAIAGVGLVIAGARSKA